MNTFVKLVISLLYIKSNKIFNSIQFNGIESVLLLCENDKPGYKMWINRSNILPIDNTEETMRELEEIYGDL